MGDPAARLPREMVVKIVRELRVLLRGASHYGAGLGALAVCSKAWWDVVVEVVYKVDGIIEGKDLLSTTRYCLKLDLSFLFESLEATAQNLGARNRRFTTHRSDLSQCQTCTPQRKLP